MKDRYVVDTNVLIAASSMDPCSPVAQDATPSDPVLRRDVFNWLDHFQNSNSHLVLDGQGGIEAEYSHKLGFNDFGRQVVIHKYSTCAVDQVDVLYDINGDAVLEEPLQTIIHDRADRKMVAAALDALEMYGPCTIAFAGDTDWHGWETDLCAAGIELKPIIPQWSKAKYLAKLGQ